MFFGWNGFELYWNIRTGNENLVNALPITIKPKFIKICKDEIRERGQVSLQLIS